MENYPRSRKPCTELFSKFVGAGKFSASGAGTRIGVRAIKFADGPIPYCGLTKFWFNRQTNQWTPNSQRCMYLRPKDWNDTLRQIAPTLEEAIKLCNDYCRNNGSGSELGNGGERPGIAVDSGISKCATATPTGTIVSKDGASNATTIVIPDSDGEQGNDTETNDQKGSSSKTTTAGEAAKTKKKRGPYKIKSKQLAGSCSSSSKNDEPGAKRTKCSPGKSSDSDG